MNIRLTATEDIPAVMALYDGARQFMRAQGNADQWTNGYPAEKLVEQDIALGRSYVCLEKDKLLLSLYWLWARTQPMPSLTAHGSTTGPTLPCIGWPPAAKSPV